jgi:hypothetical protein
MRKPGDCKAGVYPTFDSKTPPRNKSTFHLNALHKQLANVPDYSGFFDAQRNR